MEERNALANGGIWGAWDYVIRCLHEDLRYMSVAFYLVWWVDHHQCEVDAPVWQGGYTVSLEDGCAVTHNGYCAIIEMHYASVIIQ